MTSAENTIVCGAIKPVIRSPREVMTLNRLGASFPFRLSFMRILIRRLLKEKSKLNILDNALDKKGYGHAVISLSLGNKTYSLIGYTQALDTAERTDRVIATKWDACFCLFNGAPNRNQIRSLRKQVTSQEAGRFNENVLTLSRANKSIRLFNHVLQQLASGQQPKTEKLLETGYLMRTTAVYGNGKFGIADRKVVLEEPGLAAPFQVEMLTVFLIREFTFLLIEHCAKQLGGEKAATLDIDLKRFLGIGNSTGLGMAPFLVNHPCLLHSWIMAKEIALSRVLNLESVTNDQTQQLLELTKRARQHLLEWQVADTQQMKRIKETRKNLEFLHEKILTSDFSGQFPFKDIFKVSGELSVETQELMASILMELMPEAVDDLANCLANPFQPELVPSMPLSVLKTIIDTDYDWVSKISFEKGKSDALFWYTSQEKLEPRLGKRYEESGAELEMPFKIPYYVKSLDQALVNYNMPDARVADFLLDHPNLRYIVRRVQNTGKHPYSEIRGNLVGENCRPIDLLRSKLAYFGASKFDPKSDRWIRITLFQGAPISSDISACQPRSERLLDDWIFATLHSGH